MSWIREQERLEKINQNYYREPIESIHCFFLFINSNLYIEKIIDETIILDTSLEKCAHHHRILTKDKISELLKPKLESKYVLDDILLYNVTIEPNQIQSFANIDKTPFLTSGFELLDDIIIPPSIFIFHNVNALFFLCKEKPVELFIPKSIIKSSGLKVKNTKKVRIIDHMAILKNKKKNRMTRKMMN